MKDHDDGDRQDLPRAGSVSEKELVDIAWVAKRLGVKERHVCRLVAEDRIPLIKWGRLRRFDPDRPSEAVGHRGVPNFVPTRLPGGLAPGRWRRAGAKREGSPSMGMPSPSMSRWVVAALSR